MRKIDAKPLADHLTECNRTVAKCSAHVDETFAEYKRARKYHELVLRTRSRAIDRLQKAIEHNRKPWWKRLFARLSF